MEQGVSDIFFGSDAAASDSERINHKAGSVHQQTVAVLSSEQSSPLSSYTPGVSSANMFKQKTHAAAYADGVIAPTAANGEAIDAYHMSAITGIHKRIRVTETKKLCLFEFEVFLDGVAFF